MKRVLFLATLLLLLMSSALAPPLYAQPSATTGTLTDEQFFQAFPVTVPQDGQTLVITLEAASGDLDTLLYLLNPQGNILAQNDDVERGNSNSRIVYANVPAGDYIIIATRYKMQEGTSTGDFVLQVQTLPPAASPAAYAFTPPDFTAAGYPPLNPQPRAEWTVLVYYGGSSNLEPALLQDIAEFERAGGSSQQVRVVALVDRLPTLNDSGEQVKEAELFEIVLDSNPSAVESFTETRLGNIDSGDGETFARFLAWGIQQYPARHYAVALGGHGAGWRGIITDEVNDNILSLTELQSAFLTAQSLLPQGQRLDLLINDACLMSSIEYHAITAPFFDISYASPEVVFNPALDMTRLLNALKANTTNVDLADLGTQLTTVYLNEDMAALQNPFINYLTHAVTDLTAYDGVVQAIDSFAQVFLADPQRYAIVLGEARANTYTYSRFLNQTDLIDLADLMQQIIAQKPDAALQNAAQVVIQALDSVRLSSIGGDRLTPDAGYYNIYFPARSTDFANDYLTQNPVESWGQVLRAYYQQMTYQVWAYLDDITFADSQGITPTQTTVEAQIAFHAPATPKVELSSAYPPVGNANTSFAVQTTITGRNIARGQFTADYVLAEGRVQRLMISPIYTEVLQPDGTASFINSWGSGVELGSFVWDAYLDVVDDGLTSALELLTFTDDTAALHGRYQVNALTSWNDVTVLFDNNTGQVQRVVGQTANSFADVTIPNGATFQSYREYVTAEGRTTREPGTRYVWGDLTLQAIPAPDGLYNLSFEVFTHGGAVSGDTFTVTVDNTDLIDGVTGFISLDDGIALALPPDWYEFELIEDEYGLYYLSYNPDETAFYLVWYVDSLETTLEDIALDFLYEIYNTTDPAIFTPTTLSGADAFYFEAETEIGFGLFSIAGYVVLHQDTPYAFIIEGDAGTPEFEQGLAFLNEYMNLFAFGQGGFWDIGVLAEVSYPMPAAWTPTLTEDDIWEVFTPPDDETGLISVRLTELYVDLDATEPEQQSRELQDYLLETYLPAGYTLIADETYYGQYFTWQAALYIDEVRGVRGRMYVSALDDSGYAVWVEAALTDATIFTEIFEPILDGFQIIP